MNSDQIIMKKVGENVKKKPPSVEIILKFTNRITVQQLLR